MLHDHDININVTFINMKKTNKLSLSPGEISNMYRNVIQHISRVCVESETHSLAH